MFLCDVAASLAGDFGNSGALFVGSYLYNSKSLKVTYITTPMLLSFMKALENLTKHRLRKWKKQSSGEKPAKGSGGTPISTNYPSISWDPFSFHPYITHILPPSSKVHPMVLTLSGSPRSHPERLRELWDCIFSTWFGCGWAPYAKAT